MWFGIENAIANGFGRAEIYGPNDFWFALDALAFPKVVVRFSLDHFLVRLGIVRSYHIFINMSNTILCTACIVIIDNNN